MSIVMSSMKITNFSLDFTVIMMVALFCVHKLHLD